MNRNIPHVFMFIVVAVASCGEWQDQQSLTGGSLTGSEVLLTTEKSSYPQAAVVQLAIQNQESERLAYNACTRELEVWDGITWVPGPVSLRLCTRDVRYVTARTTRRDSTDLDLGLTPGEYRIVLGFARDFAPDGEAIRAISNPFTVTP